MVIKYNVCASNKLIRSMLVSHMSRDDRKIIAERVRRSTSSKRLTYMSMNPLLHVPSICLDRFIRERVNYSKLRLSSHDLKTGRWCRTPRERRLYQCLLGAQAEEHVLLLCVKTELI